VIDAARTFMTQAPGAPVDATLFDAASGQILPSNGIPGGVRHQKVLKKRQATEGMFSSVSFS
jgi:hypothetical protein